MNFQEACAEVVKQAKEENRLIFLYKNRIGKFAWGASPRYWDDWLFKAYPGGRSVFSVEGAKISQESAPANNGVQADLLPCGHPKSSLVKLRFGLLPYCEDCKRATSR